MVKESLSRIDLAVYIEEGLGYKENGVPVGARVIFAAEAVEDTGFCLFF